MAKPPRANTVYSFVGGECGGGDGEDDGGFGTDELACAAEHPSKWKPSWNWPFTCVVLPSPAAMDGDDLVVEVGTKESGIGIGTRTRTRSRAGTAPFAPNNTTVTGWRWREPRQARRARADAEVGRSSSYPSAVSFSFQALASHALCRAVLGLTAASTGRCGMGGHGTRRDPFMGITSGGVHQLPPLTGKDVRPGGRLASRNGAAVQRACTESREEVGVMHTGVRLRRSRSDNPGRCMSARDEIGLVEEGRKWGRLRTLHDEAALPPAAQIPALLSSNGCPWPTSLWSTSMTFQGMYNRPHAAVYRLPA
ncbi:hypothetical protein RJ55_04379 [Drechmeria coniospora]|nr:hypothetical protein RJ55_04379 [Drechmeria coniospora]